MEIPETLHDEEGKLVMLKISAICHQALQCPTKETMKNLHTTFTSVSTNELKENKTRILLTLLQLIAKETIGSEIKLQAANALEIVLLQNPVIEDFFLLRSIIQQFIQLLYDPQHSKLNTSLPEELHITSLKIMCLLLKNLTGAQLDKMYSVQVAPFLGVLVCVCLEEADKSQVRKIKIAAIECLMACGQVLENPPDDSELHTRTAKIFMNFVPGVVKGLQQVISADEKQGHAVTLLAVRAWGRLISQVMDDSQIAANDPIVSPKSLASAKNIAEIQQTMEKNERNEAFFKLADQWLQKNVETVCKAQRHSHHRVRLELIVSAKLLLFKCSRNLPNCVVPLLEVLVALSEDQVSEVSTTAIEAVEAVSAAFGEDSSMVEFLESNLFRIGENLPTTFNRRDPRDQVASLGLLVGYLRLLGPRLREALLMHCQIVLNSLIFVTTFECSHVVLLEDISMKGDATGFEKRSWCQHKYFNSKNVDFLLKKACRILSAESNIVIPQLLTFIVDKPSNNKEIVHLINLILQEQVDFTLGKSVIQSYLDPSLWDVQLEASAGTTIAEVRSNSVLACLLCEGLAVITCSVGQEAHKLLNLVLYPVLERAGSNTEVVALAGRIALSSIATSLGYESSTALICKEAHFFTHHMAVRIRGLKKNPEALMVLCAVLRHGSQDILPSIEPIIKDVLRRSEDTRFLPNYVDVFLALISNICQWQMQVTEDKASSASKMSFHKSPLVEELLLHQKITNASFGDSDDGSDTVDEEPPPESQENSDEKKPPPLYIQLVETVMLRCLHMLPSKNKDIQIMALRVLKKGLPLMAPHEDQLLPLVHKIWSPLVQRFSSDQNVVVLRLSFELLCVLASTSKSFIRHRCLEQVLPSICEFVKKQAAVTYKQRGVIQSQSFKLQKVALDQIGMLALNLEVLEEDVHMILESCSAYLNEDQPQPLQESCVKLLKFMTQVNCDAVWLRLNALWNNNQELSAPLSTCLNIRMPLLLKDAAKYKTNVTLLLENC